MGFFLREKKKITYLGIMLSIKARKLEGEYSKLACGAGVSPANRKCR